MIRSFIAIAIPEAIADRLLDVQDDLRDVVWQPEENLHLTLAFLGPLDRRTLEDVDTALLSVHAPSFALELAGVGAFGGRDARLVYAAVRESPELRRLQAKVETAARSAGVPLEGKRYTPHVTVGRFARGAVAPEALAAWTARHALFATAPFDVDDFALYRSDLGRNGAVYAAMATYDLDR